MGTFIKSGDELIQLLVLIILILTAIVLLVVVLNMYRVISRIIAEKEGRTIETFSFQKWWQREAGTAIPLEKEESIMLGHNYDGIQELDNHLPPWWVKLFYITIVFAVVYLGLYHIWNITPLQEEEYQIAMDEAKKEVELYQSKMANTIDEKSVKLMKDDKTLSQGKQIFTSKCAACHGQAGEGGVGPNLTDEYWLHGGTINDVFKTVKYGVPEKGMIAWQATMKPAEIQEVSNYILSIQGTNPPNAKAPQGEKASAGADSTATK
ncbi:cbb3-type cytochrome c oxidase N-terminal domain-containing protein [Emticicia sp. 21SJ11W-3]|uniref:cbb3-type cytochrome c oxidase N-terminal domain-containing protein n=1 Tax=Emticicia sp. 21SJ11W-3 TaxID=2916755 RepID=UPI0020A04341|nr:cbb3-type cytochrome c oxidase N-terminal domain-containing protein [Emticicia sp. 21SJ11W-3]UTA67139.1 c-type cytochrome [Emticicia sp. 21SJ11W-3]